MKKILQTIFSVKNSEDEIRNIVTILGIKIKFKKRLPIKNLYVGCGEDCKADYVGCDIRKMDHIKIVCKAWEVSKNVTGLENIYSRHMVEHLTFSEFKTTLIDWYKALAEGGAVHIIVPNIDFHIKQFLDADISIEAINNSKTDLSWALAGFWGWQREDYINSNSSTKYWDVHKSGYNTKIMECLLSEAGFVDINCEIVDKVHLSAKAIKP